MTARWRRWRNLCRERPLDRELALDDDYGQRITPTRYAELRQRARRRTP